MIVGTAGHIDHGKTLLVKALTGIDTDRLKEEKARGITIELGFAYLPLDDGSVLGFIDVPGHERFVHTMLAGATGIDFVLLIVAADDGVMPQTREHLDIIDILGIREGIVVLTKTDLVDEERRLAVEAEIREATARSCLAGADIYPVSAVTGAGIAAVRQRLAEEAQSRPPHETAGVFRMAIDRSFTLQGTGTVVTGTILAGAIAVGERVLGLPGGIEARVRSLHAQNRQVARAEAGERCALNVAGPGVSRDALGRGDWLSIPGHGMTTARFDADVWLLTSAPRSLKTWAPVYLHVGTSAVVAHLVLLSADQLAPGQRARAQLVLPGPLPLRTGDRIVLRDSGAERTIGGGRVIDPRAPARRRRSPARLAILEALAHSEPGEALEALLALPPYVVDLTTFTADRAMTDDEAAALVAGRPLVLVDHDGARFAMSDAAVETLEKRLVAVLERFHAEAPELPGMPDEALRRSLEPAPPRPVFPAMLRAVATRGAIVAEAGRTRRASHKSALSAADDRLWQQVRSLIAAEPHRPPTAREIGLQIGQPVAQVRKLAKTMARIGEIAEVGADRFFLRSALLELGTMADELAHASPERAFTAAAFKERVGCGRNVAIQVLEYFDRHGLTVRLGDVRRMARTPTEALMRE